MSGCDVTELPRTLCAAGDNTESFGSSGLGCLVTPAYKPFFLLPIAGAEHPAMSRAVCNGAHERWCETDEVQPVTGPQPARAYVPGAASVTRCGSIGRTITNNAPFLPSDIAES
jgi:hypothetical protein